MAAPLQKSVSGFSSHPIDGFTRRLKEDLTEIESRCKWCGAVIVGSVMHGLRDEENYHQEHCPGGKKPPAAAH